VALCKLCSPPPRSPKNCTVWKICRTTGNLLCVITINRHCCCCYTFLPRPCAAKLEKTQLQMKTMTRSLLVQWKNCRCLQTIKEFSNMQQTSNILQNAQLLRAQKWNWSETSECVIHYRDAHTVRMSQKARHWFFCRNFVKYWQILKTFFRRHSPGNLH